MIEKSRIYLETDCVSYTELSIPNKDEYEEVMNKECDHKNQKQTLVYDVPGYPYDSRYCYKCKTLLGMI